MAVTVLQTGYLYGNSNVVVGNGTQGTTLVLACGIKDATKTLSTPTDSKSNTYVTAVNYATTTVKIAVWYAYQKTALTGSSTISITGDATNPVYWALLEIDYTDRLVPATVDLQQSTGFTCTPSTLRKQDNVLGFAMLDMGTETITADSDTTGGSWSALGTVKDPGRNDRLVYQYKSNLTATTSFSWNMSFSSGITDCNETLLTFPRPRFSAYTGSAWKRVTPYVWNGSAWRQAVPKQWTGSVWQN